MSNIPEGILVVSAGMPRSGSTLLYNMLRELLWRQYGLIPCGFEDEISTLTGYPAYMIKTHSIKDFHIVNAKHIFYTFRDVRTAALSSFRMFHTPIDIELFRGLVREYCLAQKHSCLMIRYETMIANPRDLIGELEYHLGFLHRTETVFQAVRLLQPPAEGPYSRVTLLHANHFTNTGSGEWRTEIPGALLKEVRHEFAWWFEECGYPVE